jgi:DNA mismatch endonuclease, patch repair protein
MEAFGSFILGRAGESVTEYRFLNPNLRPAMDILNQRERSLRMALIRSRNTKPELAVRSLVHKLGYRFRLHRPDLPGRPDLVFASRSKVIFVHGCFWHLHSGCRNNRPPKSRLKYWRPKLQQNANRDKRTARELQRQGWRPLIIWECEIADMRMLELRIRKFLGKEARKP